MQRYVIFAGVNGAGKSTLYQTADKSIRELPRVNTDEIVRSIGDLRNANDVFAAGKMAVKKVKGDASTEQPRLIGASFALGSGFPIPGDTVKTQ